MVSDFLLPQFQLNLLFLLGINQNKFVNSRILLEVVKFFKYSKNNDKYWKKENLLKYKIEKALFIIEVLYSGYQLLFLFDNATSYLMFVLNAL